jgi:protein-tyrosine phosphatase
MSSLRSVTNFRDIGGHPTEGGGRVREGVVFRSGHLSNLDGDDRDVLESLGIRTVIDFRTGADIATDGGARLPPGARRVHAPMGDPAKAPTDLRALLDGGDPDALARYLGDGQAVELMNTAVEALVLEQQEGYARMLQTLAEPDGMPAVIHCSAGKDRTGWGASLLLLIAGVPDDTIVAHYLESNVHRADENARSLAAVPAGIDPEWMRPFFEVRAEYAETGLRTLRAHWSDVDRYVVEGLGVAEELLTALRERLLAS